MLDLKEFKDPNDKSMYFKILEFLKKSSSPNFVEFLMPKYISEPNKHIEEYLDYYCNDRLNDYAVLIRGDWGSGKTWFINEYEKKLNQDGFKKVVYISLNGVAGKDAIDDVIFCALHPVLSHRATRVLSKVATGLIKASTKIDIDADDKSGTSLSISLPTVNVKEALKEDERLILIFDDLERCQMKISEILGYINYFVEHTESRAIILANEEKLKTCETYQNEKEKLVGATFKFEGDIHSALVHIIDELPRSDVKFKLKTEDMVNIIIDIYKKSELNNIRSFKQSLREFSRFFKISYSKNDDELFEKILRIYLILSLEHRVKGSKLEFFNSTYTVNEDNEVNQIWENYKFDILSNLILSGASWRKIIVDSVLDDECIKDEIEKNYFAYKAEPPVWYKLWNYYDISKTEFLNCIDITKKDLRDGNLKEFGEVFHSVSNLIFFKNIIAINIEEIKKIAEQCILKIYSDSNIGNINVYDNLELATAWGGYSYLANSNEDFKNFFKLMRSKLKEHERENIDVRAQKLFELLTENFSLFLEKIKFDGSQNDFYKTAILHRFDAKKFAKIYIELNRKDFRLLGSVLDQRYSLPENSFTEKELEINWIKLVIQELDSIKSEKDGIESFRIENFHINSLEKILKNYV